MGPAIALGLPSSVTKLCDYCCQDAAESSDRTVLGGKECKALANDSKQRKTEALVKSCPSVTPGFKIAISADSSRQLAAGALASLNRAKG